MKEKDNLVLMNPTTIMMVGTLPLDITSVKGGVEAVIVNLLSGFATFNNVKVTHVSFTKETKQPKELRISEHVKICYLPFKTRFDLIDFFFNGKQLKSLISLEKPDIIHVQESSSHLLRFIDFPKENIVVTQHGVMKEEIKYAKGLNNKLKYLFKVFVERYVFARFKNVIFISNYNKAFYSGKAINSKSIYNPVNLSFFKVLKEPSKPFSILYVGVINRRKNIIILLLALAELKKQNIIYTLNVVGGFKDAAYEIEVREILKRHNLSNQVKFHGWLRQEQILKVYQECEYFVLPSSQETLPVSVAEAMALGKIVIATDVGAVSEMFENEHSGLLFKRNDVESLTEVLKKLYQDRKLFSHLGENARSVASSRYKPSFVAEQTIAFYKEIISNNDSILKSII